MLGRTKSTLMLVCLVAFAACGAVQDGKASMADPSGASSRTSSKEDGSDLEAALAAIAARDGVPGFAFAVVSADGVDDAAGVGLADVRNDVPVTPDTLFHIGSTHKALNALLVATLVDDGTLDWDSSLAEVNDDVAIDPDITMRHLLTMTSGLPASSEDGLPDGAVGPTAVGDTVFGAFEDARLLGPPGSAFAYSNVSAAAAGYMAVAAHDPDETDLYQGYLDLFTDRVLEPLDMSDSKLLASEATATGMLSRSYTVGEDGPVMLESEDSDVDVLAPSGSLKSSANDMAKFLRALLAHGSRPDGTRIVTPDSIDEMWRPALQGYAMGWQIDTVDGVEYLSHEGSFDGFVSLIMVIPGRDVGFVLLANSEDATGLIRAAPGLLAGST